MTQKKRSSKKSCGPILFSLSWYIWDGVNHCGTIPPGSITTVGRSWIRTICLLSTLITKLLLLRPLPM